MKTFTRPIQLKVLTILLLLAASVGLSIGINSSVHAANSPIQSTNCQGKDHSSYVTNYKSPYSYTNYMCIGKNLANDTHYFQFAIYLQAGAVADATVSAVNGKGQDISFANTGNNRLFVSIPSSGAGIAYDSGMGYGATTPTVSCNKDDPYNQITITTNGNGKNVKTSINLCSYTGNTQAVIYSTVTGLTSDNGGVGTTGALHGILGVVRDDPIAQSVKYAPIQEDGLVSIKLTGPQNDSTLHGSWYTPITDGDVTIPNLKPGINYSLTITYNDKVEARKTIVGDVSGEASSSVTYSFSKLTVTAGKTTEFTGGKIQYENTSGKIVTKPTTNGSITPTKTCVVDGIGWIVCSVASFVASIADGIYGLIEQLFTLSPVNTNITDGTNGEYNAWVIMRTFANIIFVILFLIIIFSQLTSVGISNYGIKKTLPRLVLVAILVNVSYWIAAIAVDVSNIAGYGVYQIFENIVKSMNIGISSSWSSIISALLAGTGIGVVATGAAVGVGAVAVATGAALPLLYLAIPLVLTALLAVFVAIFILIARQAIIVILVIAAPLAFVAILLPNTQKLFSQWRKLFTSLLVMFPIVSFIFGGAQVAGFAILASAQSTTASAVPDTSSMLKILTSQFVIVAPFFFIPFLITKFSGGNIDRMAANVANRGRKLTSVPSKMANKEGNRRMGQAFNATKYGAQPTDNSLRSRLRRGIGGGGRTYDQYRDRLDQTDSYLKAERHEKTNERLAHPTTGLAYATKIAGGDSVAGARIQQRAQAAAKSESLKRELQPLQAEVAAVRASGISPDDFLEQRATDMRPEITQEQRNAALHLAASLGRDKVMVKLKNRVDPTEWQEAVSANGGALVAKAPHLVKGEAGAFNNVKAKELAGFTETTANAYMDHLSKLKASGDAAYPDAVKSFNAALETLSADPNRKGDFGLESARALQAKAAEMAKTDLAISADLSIGLKHIDGNGKLI